MVLAFTHPLAELAKIGWNVFWHYRDITNDLKEAKAAWNNKQFRDFGEFIGMMIEIALNGERLKAVQGTKEVAQVIEGVMFGMFGQEYPIEECLGEGETLWEDVSKAAFYIKSGHLADIGEAFKYVGDAF